MCSSAMTDGRTTRRCTSPLTFAAIRSFSPGFVPAANAVGDFSEGEALVNDESPSEATTAILQFCEQFEAAGQRTAAFMEDLKKSDLLMDGEVAIQPEGFEQPFVYRGFRMVD